MKTSNIIIIISVLINVFPSIILAQRNKIEIIEVDYFSSINSHNYKADLCKRGYVYIYSTDYIKGKNQNRIVQEAIDRYNAHNSRTVSPTDIAALICYSPEFEIVQRSGMTGYSDNLVSVTETYSFWTETREIAGYNVQLWEYNPERAEEILCSDYIFRNLFVGNKNYVNWLEYADWDVLCDCIDKGRIDASSFYIDYIVAVFHEFLEPDYYRYYVTYCRWPLRGKVQKPFYDRRFRDLQEFEQLIDEGYIPVERVYNLFLENKSKWDDWYIEMDSLYQNEHFTLDQVDWNNKDALPYRRSDTWYYGYYLEILELLEANLNKPASEFDD